MVQEFRISTGMKIVYGLLAACMGGFALFMLYVSAHDANERWVFIAVPVFLACMVLIVINLFKRRVVIDGHCLICVNVFSRKELELSQIKGYRSDTKSIVIEPLSSSDPRIVIRNYTELADDESLFDWFKNNLKDLDAIEFEKEQEEVLQNSQFGATEEERKENFVKAKRITNWYNGIGLAMMFSFIFLRNKSADILLLSYPWIGVLIMILSKGIIKFVSNVKRSPHPNILLGLLMPGLILLLRSVGEYDVFQLQDILLPAFIIGAILFSLLYVTGMNKAMGSVDWQIFFMLIAAFALGFGSARQLNCEFDQSKPAVYTAAVLDHRVIHGKSSSYYLTLSPWGPRQHAEEVGIGSTLYQQAAIGDSVRVVLREGLLRIPWYFVMK